MKINSIYYFNYSKEIGFYESISDFRLEEMKYTNLALSTPKIKVNSSLTEYKINKTGSNRIREYVISKIDQLKEISQMLAENSPKYIIIYFADNTKCYYEYNEDFCKIFEIVNEHKIIIQKEDYENPYTIQKNETEYSYPNKPLPYSYDNKKNNINNSQNNKKTTLKSYFALVFGIAALLIFLLVINKNSKDNISPALIPINEPYSGEILSGSEIYEESEITINAASNKSYVVKLKDYNGVERLSFYVRAGDTVTVGVPADYLYIYFASGETWYGKEKLFGENTNYQMVEDIEDFTEYTWEYTLYPVNDGNLSLSTINEYEF